jgi:hypothetical protein
MMQAARHEQVTLNGNHRGYKMKKIIFTLMFLLIAGIALASSNSNNIVLNGNFEFWYAGTSSAPDAWNLAGTGASVAQSADEYRGTYAAQLTYGSADASLYSDYWSNYADYQGETVTISAWVKTSTASIARIYIYDGVTTTYSSYHTGGGSYERLDITVDLDGSATTIQTGLRVSGSGNAIIDCIMMTEGSSIFAYAPHNKDHLYGQCERMISPMEMKTGTDNVVSTRGDILYSWSYLYPEGQNYQSHLSFPLPNKLSGHTVVLDSLVFYIWTDSSSSNVDYIDQILLAYNNGQGSEDAAISRTDDIANGSNGYTSVDLITTNGSPYEMVSNYGYSIYVVSAGMDAADSGVRYYGIKVLYHLKVHD